MSKTPERPHVSKPSRKRVFSHGGSSLRAALYARVSTHDQQTLPIQLSAMRQYVRKRGWATAFEVKEVGSGGALRQKRAELLAAARRREEVIIVWRLDRWGRSVVDLVTTLTELSSVKVGFVSLTEALDLTTPSGRALAGMLAVFAEFERDILRDRVKAGVAQGRKEGRPHGRPQTVTKHVAEIKSSLRRASRNVRSPHGSRLAEPQCAGFWTSRSVQYFPFSEATPICAHGPKNVCWRNFLDRLG